MVYFFKIPRRGVVIPYSSGQVSDCKPLWIFFHFIIVVIPYSSGQVSDTWFLSLQAGSDWSRNPLFIRASFGQTPLPVEVEFDMSRNPLFIRASFGRKELRLIVKNVVEVCRNPLFIRASFLIRKDTRVSFLTLLSFQGANNLSLCTFIISFCPQKERSPRESVPRVECYPLFIRASFGPVCQRPIFKFNLSRNPLFIRASFGPCKTNSVPIHLWVVIPYSSGQVSDKSKRNSWWTHSWRSRNPLFIRASFGLIMANNKRKASKES